jgi:hypothetical protein
MRLLITSVFVFVFEFQKGAPGFHHSSLAEIDEWLA